MNRTEKRIYDESNKTLNGVSDKKDENRKKIVDEFFPENVEKSKSIKFWITISVSSAVIVASSALSIILLSKNYAGKSAKLDYTDNADNIQMGCTAHISVDDDGDKTYYSDSEAVAISSLEELSELYDEFQLSLDSETVKEIKRLYLTETDDTLLYSITVDDGKAKIAINYYTNPELKPDFDLSAIILLKQYHGVDVRYIYAREGMNFTAYAYFEKGDQTLVVDFSLRTFSDDEQQFWDYIESMIIVN